MKFLFYYVSFLNILDAFLTSYGLQHSLISEANPIMEKLYEISPNLFLATKLSLSGFLLLFILFDKVPNTKVVKGVTVIGAAIYSIIFLLHSFWIALIII